MSHWSQDLTEQCNDDGTVGVLCEECTTWLSFTDKAYWEMVCEGDGPPVCQECAVAREARACVERARKRFDDVLRRWVRVRAEMMTTWRACGDQDRVLFLHDRLPAIKAEARNARAWWLRTKSDERSVTAVRWGRLRWIDMGDDTTREAAE